MTGLVRKATLLGVCGLLLAAIASANVPDPTNSSTPSFIDVGGIQGANGLPDAAITFSVTVRDFANNPIAGSFVEVNFIQCDDTKLCTINVAGQTRDCANKAIRATTNASGVATVKVLGASNNTGLARPGIEPIFPGAGAGCVRVYADGIQIGTSTAVIFDQNGTLPGNNGLAPGDIAVVVNEVGHAGVPGTAYKGRTDYSKNGDITAADIGFFIPILARAVSGTGSLFGCSLDNVVVQPYCPESVVTPGDLGPRA
jgi:hypothetical protein